MSDWRGRVFRDPIHGDVRLGPIQSRIVDTTLFQRLRFIRQNGLLHLVFPGAVHTRFSHSIGTAHLAQRVFASIFPQYSPAQAYLPNQRGSGLTYVGSTFVTAALLHDLGHCAFSHSIERVNTSSGAPFLPKLDVLAQEWSEDIPGLQSLWSKFFAGTSIPERTEHEHIGYLMICALFCGKYAEVVGACDRVIGVSATKYCQDVLAILIGGNQHPPTKKFADAAVEITAEKYKKGRPEAKSTVTDLIAALHSLVSGTIDVDRLDYLSRDSHYIGAPYGLCDTEVLVNGLRLAESVEEGTTHLVLALKARATQALDDMLWGRFQLFSQVLNHKTNAMLNALLADAIPEALDDAQVNLKQPRTFDDFLLFTDDHVMSAVMTACVHNERLTKRAYARALVHRKLPLYLQHMEVDGTSDGDEAIEKRKSELAQSVLKGKDRAGEIRTWRVESALLKRGGGTMPYVVRRDKLTGNEVVLPPSEPGLYKLQEWCAKNMLPMMIDTCHFFVDHEKVTRSS